MCNHKNNSSTLDTCKTFALENRNSKALILVLLLLSQLFFCISGAWATQIVFFKSFSPNGEPIVFEGLYSHAAISVGGSWLHAHPYYGVTVSKDLKNLGPDFVLLENTSYIEPSPEFIARQLHMNFNIFAPWKSFTETYCSKLVGQALNMTPSKMRFNSSNWQKTGAASHRGQLGLSPSDIYWYARRKLGFKKAKNIPDSLFKKISSSSCSRYL